MMKHQGAKHDVVCAFLSEGENVASFEINFWIVSAQALRNFQGGLLLVDRLHHDLRADFSGIAKDKARNIARAGPQIEDPHLRAGLDPASEEMPDERIAPKVAIELAQVMQIAHQLGRHWLRPVHPFWLGRIKLTLHQSSDR